jgi:hypothetical protein
VLAVGPTGTAEDERQTLAPAHGSADVPQHVEMLVAGDARGIERVEILRQAVDDGFGFRFEGAEQPVPRDQDAAVVSVKILLIAAVVDAMV